MDAESAPKTSSCVGLFLVVLATIMYEIVLTRIFSVTMWYHFAFVAISIAMFGMTVGASFLIQLLQPFGAEWSFFAVMSSMVTYAIIAVPFVFSGICVTLSLARFPGSVGRPDRGLRQLALLIDATAGMGRSGWPYGPVVPRK